MDTRVQVAVSAHFGAVSCNNDIDYMPTAFTAITVAGMIPNGSNVLQIRPRQVDTIPLLFVRKLEAWQCLCYSPCNCTISMHTSNISSGMMPAIGCLDI